MDVCGLGHDAKEAFSKIRDSVFEIRLAVQGMSEPFAQGVGSSRESTCGRGQNSVMIAVADAIDRVLEIKARHRSGRGI